MLLTHFNCFAVTALFQAAPGRTGKLRPKPTLSTREWHGLHPILSRQDSRSIITWDKPKSSTMDAHSRMQRDSKTGMEQREWTNRTFATRLAKWSPTTKGCWPWMKALQPAISASPRLEFPKTNKPVELTET